MKIMTLLKLELYKLINKKTTYLLLITFLVPIIFSIGMFTGTSFLYNAGSESFDVITNSRISAIDFAVSMYTQITYITYLIVIIIASIVLSSEIEHGQILLFVKRICNRKKILLSKYFSLLILLALYFILFIFISIILYYLFVSKSDYGNGTLLSTDMQKSLGIFLFSYMGLAMASAITILFGVWIKTFACFAVSYVLWIVSKYLVFFKRFQQLMPDSCVDYIIKNNMSVSEIVIRFGLFIIYISIIMLFAIRIINKKDLR